MALPSIAKICTTAELNKNEKTHQQQRQLWLWLYTPVYRHTVMVEDNDAEAKHFTFSLLLFVCMLAQRIGGALQLKWIIKTCLWLLQNDVFLLRVLFADFTSFQIETTRNIDCVCRCRLYTFQCAHSVRIVSADILVGWELYQSTAINLLN